MYCMTLSIFFFFEVLGDNFTKELLKFLAYDWFELGLCAFRPFELLLGRLLLICKSIFLPNLKRNYQGFQDTSVSLLEYLHEGSRRAQWTSYVVGAFSPKKVK